MVEKAKIDIIRKVLSSFSIIIIVSFVWAFSKTDFVRAEVLNECLDVGLEYLVYPVHGRFLCGLLTKMAGFANAWFDIHPMTYMTTIGAVIKGFFYAGICYFMAESVNIFAKRKLFVTPFITLICFFSSFFLDIIEYGCYTQFYGYSVCLIFFFIGCATVFKNFSLQTKPSGKIFPLLLNSFVAVFIGQSSHLENVSFAALLFFVFAWFFVKFGKEEKWKISSIFSKLLTTGKEIYIPVFLFFTSMIYTYSNSFMGMALHNYQEVAENLETSRFSIDFFSRFIKDYLSLLQDCLPYFIVIVAFLVWAFFCTKDKKLFFRFLYIELSLIFALLFFFFNLWTLKETFYLGGFWLQHLGMRCLLFSILFYLCWCSFGFFFNNLDEKYDKAKNLIFSSIVALSLYLLVLSPVCRLKIAFFMFEKPKTEHKFIKSFYVLEKIILTYSVQHKDSYLPQSYLVYFPDEYINTEDYLIFFEEHYDPEKKLEVLKNNSSRAFRVLSEIYFYDNYKIYAGRNVSYFVPDDEAFEKFKQIGGSFTQEELEKIDFQNLKKYAVYLREKYLQKK